MVFGRFFNNGGPGEDPEQNQAQGQEDAEQQSGPVDFREKYVRAMAEMENLRKRMRRDEELARVRERESVLRSMLPVLDSFERAVQLAGEEHRQWMEGFVGILAQLEGVLGRYGAKRFDPTGATFDPMRHEAVAVLKDPSREDGSILEVTRAGYEMENGDVLRPAQVVVVRNEA